MKKKILFIMITLSVPLMLYVNVWQSYKYTSSYFEVESLIDSQEKITIQNNILLNKVAELQSPGRLIDIAGDSINLVEINENEVVRVEVIKR